MVRENRIKEYRFNPGSLVANAGEVIDTYTSYPLNGTLQMVELLVGNWEDTGSIYITVSGTGETLLYFASGTSMGTTGVGEDQFVYPQVFAVDNTGTAGSPNVMTQRVINSLIRVAGGNLGSGKSGLGLNLKYI